MSADKKKPQKRGNAAEANGQPSASPATEASVPAVVPLSKEFEGHSLTVLWRDGKPWWIAREVGAALGYEDGSKLVDQISDEWSDEFIEGTDFVRVTGKALAEVKAFLSQQESGGMTPRVTGSQRGGAQSMLLLSESGVNLAAIKTRKPAGKRLRRWLASDVLPSIARNNALSTATEEQINFAVRAEMARQFRTPESRFAEIMRLATNASETMAKVLGCDPSQVRGSLIELAKGLVGYGGTGRELGYVSTRQFKAMQALLRGIPTLAALAPRRRRKQLAKALEAGTSEALQQVLPIFRAEADVGSAVVTVTVTPKKKEAA